MIKIWLYGLCAIMFTFLALMPSSMAAVGKTKVAYSPKPINDVLHNPYMGLAPDARYVPYTQEHTLVYANITWREIEPEKGEYQFDQIEEELHFDKSAEKGITFIIRIIMDYPEEKSQMEIPDWLYEELDGDGDWYENGYGKGFSPNYGNRLLIDYHKKLISKPV